MNKKRLLRITTVPMSLVTLLNGQLTFVQEHNFDVLAVSSDGPEVGQLKAIGVPHVAIRMTRKITPLRDGLALIQLILLMLKFKPHIVHTHTPKAGLLGMLAAWICRVPVRMHTIAGLAWAESIGAKRGLLQFMEKSTYWCAHRVYPNSKNLSQFLQQRLGFNDAKMKVIGRGSSNGINEEFFALSEEIKQQAANIRVGNDIRKEEVVFCFVGRVVKDKGIVELVTAFMEISQRGNMRLLVVGNLEQDLNPVPANILQILNNDARIIMAGFQTDVRPWLACADIFVLPSYREGFPNVVMQAACMQLPCIVSNINGCNEIIEPDLSGLLIAPKDIDRLKEAMIFLANDPIRRKAFGKAGRDFVSRNFSQRLLWSELLKEYQR